MSWPSEINRQLSATPKHPHTHIPNPLCHTPPPPAYQKPAGQFDCRQRPQHHSRKRKEPCTKMTRICKFTMTAGAVAMLAGVACAVPAMADGRDYYLHDRNYRDTRYREDDYRRGDRS